jgi:hypothetical protein
MVYDDIFYRPEEVKMQGIWVKGIAMSGDMG